MPHATGRIDPDPNSDDESKPELKTDHDISQEKAEAEAALAAEQKAKEDAAAAVIKRREDGREALHATWAKHQVKPYCPIRPNVYP